MLRRTFPKICVFALVLVVPVALSSASAQMHEAASEPVGYDTFVHGAVAQHGLFTLWHKGGRLYVELAAAQIGADFVQTVVPSSGVGGAGVVWGNTDHLPAEIVRFERAGNAVAIVWANPAFVAPHSPEAAAAIDRSFAKSIVGLAPIAAVDERSGKVVFDASPFLEDQMNLRAVLAAGIKDSPGAAPYALDRERSYFGATKAFPKNIVIEALQDWMSDDQHVADAVPDPRHLQMHVTYNIAQPPHDDDYRVRYADDRVGIYDDIYLSFDDDQVLSRKLRYVVRWNLQPSDPSKPVSPAKHPMVFTMSDTVPERYRAAIKAAVLKWNDAFLPLGISDALQVVDQPKDPDFDPDDIRYNMLRWVTEYKASFGADSQTLYDPTTGQEFRTGVLISADVPKGAYAMWKHTVDPIRFGRSTDPMPQSFLDGAWMSTILHETGHNLGLQHNFIGSRAYTAKELQDPAFTAKYGIASTVMEYAPLNIWPRGTPNGSFDQTTLGPYDYYAMHWTYGVVPGAATPEDEVPTLQKWAAAWSDPHDRYASDEDVSWANGHAADPRVEQGILTNDPLGWCAVQLPMDRRLMAESGRYFPAAGAAYEDEKDAFDAAFARYMSCATMPVHYLGGQYLSRAHRGDPHADPPVVPVPRDEQQRAFGMLDAYLFGASAWTFAPDLLQQLGYSEWSGYGYVELDGYGNLPRWAYAPPERHDVALGDRIAQRQTDAIPALFRPRVLARIADGPAESRDAHPMTLADLFAWMHASVFRELGGDARSIDPLRRTLQASYTNTLVTLYVDPAPGTPSDARALARAELTRLQTECTRTLGRAGFDPTTRAHVELVRARAHDALANGRPA